MAGNEHPNPGTIKEVVLLELQRLLRSPNVADVKYSIRTLNTLSSTDRDKAPDFSRNEVMGKLLPLLSHEDDVIATDTVSTLGSRNPYMRDDYAAGWLASIGRGQIRGYSSWEQRDNETGRRYWMHLSAVVTSGAPVERRALALRAMGLAREPKILPLLKECLSSDEPLIVQAATILLADYPYQFDLNEIKVLAADTRPLVRRGAAQVIGFGQMRPLVTELDKLLSDDDPTVVQAAALSILSFSLEDSRKVLENHAKHAVFARLFVNALAHESPGLYLDELCQSVRTDVAPKGWWGGYSVWGESWNILFEYVRDFPADLPAATRDKLLDALESPASGNKEGTRYYSSSEPRDLYAMYIQKKMKERAKAFREKCKKGLTYDMEIFFNDVDANPSHYLRESR